MCYHNIMKNRVESKKNTKHSKRTIALYVIGILILLCFTSFVSYGYYIDNSSSYYVGGKVYTLFDDIIVKTYLQDFDTEEETVSDTYTQSDYIPTSIYKLNEEKTSCDDGITINGVIDGKLDISATKKGRCKVYFDIDTESTDLPNIIVNLYSQDNVRIESIPDDDYIYIAREKDCTDGATALIVDNAVEVKTTSANTVCNVFVDITDYQNLRSFIKEAGYNTLENNGYRITDFYYDDLDEDGYSDYDMIVSYLGYNWKVLGIFDVNWDADEDGIADTNSQLVKLIYDTSNDKSVIDDYYYSSDGSLSDYNDSYLGQQLNSTFLTDYSGIANAKYTVYKSTTNAYKNRSSVLSLTAETIYNNEITGNALLTKVGLPYYTDYFYTITDDLENINTLTVSQIVGNAYDVKNGTTTYTDSTNMDLVSSLLYQADPDEIVFYSGTYSTTYRYIANLLPSSDQTSGYLANTVKARPVIYLKPGFYVENENADGDANDPYIINDTMDTCKYYYKTSMTSYNKYCK